MADPLLSPDTTHTPSYASERVADIVHAADARYRTVLTQDAEGRFRVRAECWDIGDAEFTGSGHWLPIGRTTTITGTLEHARAVAVDRLAELRAAPFDV